MSEWKEYRLGDICEIFAGGDAPKEKYSKLKTNEYNIPIFSNGITDEGLYGYTDKARVLTPATTITARGTVGVVFRRKEPYFPIVRLISVIGNKELLDSDFLYYKLKSTYIDGEGSVQAQLTVPMISNYRIDIPSLEKQRSIASILSALDEKIAVNRRICENLEAQAQALFKNWFIDFAPFKNGQFVESELGMIPEGWRVGRLEELGDIVGGATPSKAEDSYYTSKGIAWLTPKDLSNKLSKFTSRGEIDLTQEGYNSCSAKLMPKGSVLFSSRAPIGYLTIAKNDICTNQGFKSVVPKYAGTAYIYYLLKTNTKRIESMSSGTTFKEASGSLMKSLAVIIPPKSIIDNYEASVVEIFNEQEVIEDESSRLSTLRDTLLPKLMSGQIKV